MIARYNYLRTPSVHERLGGLPVPSAHARGTLLAVGAAALGVAGIAGVELHRTADLDRRFAGLHERYVATASSARDMRALADEVATLQRDLAALDADRRTSQAALDEVVLVGNRLPEGTWLTALRAERGGTWSVEGRAERLNEVAAALSRLGAVGTKAGVRLVSVNRSERRPLRFALAWERRP